MNGFIWDSRASDSSILRDYDDVGLSLHDTVEVLLSEVVQSS